MKKLVCIALMLVCLLTLSVNALAANPTIELTDASGKVGETVTVDIKIVNNPGLAILQIDQVVYDSSVLKWIGASIASGLDGSATVGGKLYWWGTSDGSNKTDDFTFATLTFEVIGVGDGSVSVVYRQSETVNADEEEVVFSVDAVSVSVSHDHDYSVAKLVSEATCKGAAVYEKTCSICGASNGETYTEGEALPHTEKDLAAVAPTCTETGLTAGKVCEVCGVEIVKQETVPATGHKGGTATCAEKAKCDVCGVAYGEVDKDNHPADALVTQGAKDATCTEDGSTGVGKCNACGTEFDKATVIPAKGHSFGEYTVTKEATCTEKGEETATCSVCGEKDTKEIDKVPHDYKETNRVEATCDTEGYIESKCSVCGADTAKILPALGHKWGEWKVTVEATKTEKGEKVRVCEVCQETETKEIPATGSVAPKTGDEANIALYAVMFVMAGAAVVALSTKKKEN